MYQEEFSVCDGGHTTDLFTTDDRKQTPQSVDICLIQPVAPAQTTLSILHTKTNFTQTKEHSFKSK